MRLIDADELMKDLKNQIPLAENVSIFIDIIESQPTAYDVDKVVEQIHEIGTSFCDNVKCNKDCEDCEHGCIIRAIEGEVKAGGINDK